MPVYVDDPYSPSIDEGCEHGDPIALKVNGFEVEPYVPLFWQENGTL